MSEIYWITRFDPINTCAKLVLVISAIVIIVLIFCTFICAQIKDKESLNICKKFLKHFIPIFAVALLIKIFVPTTKEALLIYGVGGTIDYVKSNPVAKKLPDKCVNALDKWVDSWTIEEKTDTIK